MDSTLPDLDAPARHLVRALAADAGSPAPGADGHAHRLYDALRDLARSHRARWAGNHTLNTTAIVHEAYLKVASWDGFKGEDHFLAVASRAMRQVLVSYAGARHAQKRGGRQTPVALDDAPESALLTDPQIADVLTVDAALARLARLDPRAAQVVEARIFGGLTEPETAAALGISEATAARDWRRARAWLRGELGEAPPTLATLA